jgi:biofilm PGA synthesis N-glycosyltransferase PgaC
MRVAAALFWLGAFLILYNYIGYGLLIALLAAIRSRITKTRTYAEAGLPEVSLIIAAYNEEEVIAAKIHNCRQLEYPSDRLHVVFVTDGSTDASPDMIKREAGIQLMHHPARLGKTAAINRAMESVRSPIVIFSDANTLLNPEAVTNIVRHYQDPRVGGVAGEKKVIGSQAEGGTGSGEGLYWKYESLLKKLDASFWTVVGAAGELFSVRKSLYEPLDSGIILDDFVISLKIAAKGYRVAYEPDAYAMEAPSSNIVEEQKRKIRICAGGFQAMILLHQLLNIFRYPSLSFQYISHRVLRWTLTPLFLPVVFLANLVLVAGNSGNLYVAIFLLQLLFYFSALAGLLLTQNHIRSRIFYVPYYFLFMNYSVYLGFFRFLQGRQSAIWEKASRGKFSPDQS